jgi:hypothetical protein
MLFLLDDGWVMIGRDIQRIYLWTLAVRVEFFGDRKKL